VTQGTNSQGGATGGGDTVSRIKEAQARLDELLLKFTDKHPDVVAMRRTLEDLNQRRAAEMDALRRGDANAAALTGASTNPVYQNIQLELNKVEVEIASAKAALQDHQEKVTEQRRFADTMPQVEAEYARLNRDYTVTKAQYTALAERLEKAHVGEEAEASGSVRFEVVDPPSSPFKPVSPKRLLLLISVLIVGLGVGVGLAYLLSILKPVFYNIRTLAQITGVTVLGAVSLTHSESERSAMRGALIRYSAFVGVLFVVFLAVAYLGLRYSPLLAKARLGCFWLRGSTT
jgi:polysaccharide chain length determinant protein (PEP-CTERM system associated)